MKIRCRHCGDLFTPDVEDVLLWENGHIDEITKVCEECYIDQNNQNMDYMDYSDVDPGL